MRAVAGKTTCVQTPGRPSALTQMYRGDIRNRIGLMISAPTRYRCVSDSKPVYTNPISLRQKIGVFVFYLPMPLSKVVEKCRPE